MLEQVHKYDSEHAAECKSITSTPLSSLRWMENLANDAAGYSGVVAQDQRVRRGDLSTVRTRNSRGT